MLGFDREPASFNAHRDPGTGTKLHSVVGRTNLKATPIAARSRFPSPALPSVGGSGGLGAIRRGEPPIGFWASKCRSNRYYNRRPRADRLPRLCSLGQIMTRYHLDRTNSPSDLRKRASPILNSQRCWYRVRTSSGRIRGSVHTYINAYFSA